MSSSGRDEATTDPMLTTMVTHTDQHLDQSNILRDHISITFDAGSDSYEEFIQKIRDVLAHSNSHGIPVLTPQRPETPENAQWLDIRLILGADIITVRLEQSNLYLRGYQRTSSGEDFFWEFTDTHLIPGSRDLMFSGSYSGSGGIVNKADVLRENLPLGARQLERAIRNLAWLEDPLGSNNRRAAENLLILVLMISEGARLRTIAEHIVADYWNAEGVRLDGRMVGMINGWNNLSTAVLQTDLHATPNTPLPNIPRNNPSEVYTFGQALAAMGILLITRPQRGLTANGEDYGRYLMNLEFVRINDIDGEDPGNLFGSVRVNDGWFTYTFYDRGSGDYENVGPGGFATLTDPSQPHAVSGADAFVISVDLFDQDTLSPNDKIAQGEIVWDRIVESVTFGLYDNHMEQVVKGENGNVMVGFSVLTNALCVTIQVILIDGDGENPADVCGTLEAYQLLHGYAGTTPITLFKKSFSEYVEVGKGQPIPLTRKVMAASTASKLTIKADLWDHDAISPDDPIAQGSVDFTVQPGTQKQYINGQNGQVQVIITCV